MQQGRSDTYIRSYPGVMRLNRPGLPRARCRAPAHCRRASAAVTRRVRGCCSTPERLFGGGPCCKSRIRRAGGISEKLSSETICRPPPQAPRAERGRVLAVPLVPMETCAPDWTRSDLSLGVFVSMQKHAPDKCFSVTTDQLIDIQRAIAAGSGPDERGGRISPSRGIDCSTRSGDGRRSSRTRLGRGSLR